jgi:hypothetical protein
VVVCAVGGALGGSVSSDLPGAGVDEPGVVAAEQDQVVQRGVAAADRVLEVMGVAHHRGPGAAREPAVGVAGDQGLPDGGDDQALRPADVENLGGGAHDGGDEVSQRIRRIAMAVSCSPVSVRANPDCVRSSSRFIVPVTASSIRTQWSRGSRTSSALGSGAANRITVALISAAPSVLQRPLIQAPAGLVLGDGQMPAEVRGPFQPVERPALLPQASNGQFAYEEPDRKVFCGRLSYGRDAVRGGGRWRSSGPPGTEEKRWRTTC